MAQRPKPHLLKAQNKTQNVIFHLSDIFLPTQTSDHWYPRLSAVPHPGKRSLLNPATIRLSHSEQVSDSPRLNFLLRITATCPSHHCGDSDAENATASLPPVVTELREALWPDTLCPLKAKSWGEAPLTTSISVPRFPCPEPRPQPHPSPG